MYKDVALGDELLVWYGEEYAEELGIESEELEDENREKILKKCNYAYLFFDLAFLVLKIIRQGEIFCGVEERVGKVDRWKCAKDICKFLTSDLS